MARLELAPDKDEEMSIEAEAGSILEHETATDIYALRKMVESYIQSMSN